MSRRTRTIETTTATLTLVSPRWVEQRYKPSSRFSLDALQENRIAREQLCNGEPCVVLITVPADVAIEPPLTNQDHFRPERNKKSILALAVVTASTIMHSVTKFYFIYFQQAFPVKVFDDEHDARAWLTEQLATNAGARP